MADYIQIIITKIVHLLLTKSKIPNQSILNNLLTEHFPLRKRNNINKYRSKAMRIRYKKQIFVIFIIVNINIQIIHPLYIDVTYYLQKPLNLFNVIILGQFIVHFLKAILKRKLNSLKNSRLSHNLRCFSKVLVIVFYSNWLI